MSTSPEPTPQARPHIAQLDGLRGIAILMVFVFHAFKANLFWMGVDLFFVLSGFLITGILLNEKDRPFGNYIGRFYARRVRRIAPAYLVVLVVTAVIFGTGFLHYWYLYIGGMNFLIPLDLPYLKTLPLWSLAVEEQFYLLWPLAVFFLSRKHLMQLAIILLVAAPVLRFIFTPLMKNGYSIYMLLPFRMDTLASGALIAILWPQIQSQLASNPIAKKNLIRGGWILLGCGLVSAIALNSLGFLPATGNRIGSTTLMEATLMIATGMFGLALIGIGRKGYSSKPLVFLGRISYSFYLFHLTALYLVPKNNGILGFILTVAYSAAMWYLVESPILNQGKKQKVRTAAAH